MLFLLSIYSSLFTGLIEKTVVLTPAGLLPIERLQLGNSVIASQEASTKIIAIKTNRVDKIYRFQIAQGEFYTSNDQLFYDPVAKAWIPAESFTTENMFLDKDSNHIPCLSIYIYHENALPCYDLTLQFPHTFYVSEACILTHNFLPFAVGIAIAFGEGITITGAGFSLGALGLGLWKHFQNKKEIKLTNLEQEMQGACSGGSPEDPEKEDIKYTFKNGIFNNRNQHPKIGNSRKSACPANGQHALDNSFQIKNLNKPRRIAISNEEFVVLDRTMEGEFHGHVRTWEELDENMQNTLIEVGLVTHRGKIIK